MKGTPPISDAYRRLLRALAQEALRQHGPNFAEPGTGSRARDTVPEPKGSTTRPDRR